MHNLILEKNLETLKGKYVIQNIQNGEIEKYHQVLFDDAVVLDQLRLSALGE